MNGFSEGVDGCLKRHGNGRMTFGVLGAARGLDKSELFSTGANGVG